MSLRVECRLVCSQVQWPQIYNKFSFQLCMSWQGMGKTNVCQTSHNTQEENTDNGHSQKSICILDTIVGKGRGSGIMLIGFYTAPISWFPSSFICPVVKHRRREHLAAVPCSINRSSCRGRLQRVNMPPGAPTGPRPRSQPCLVLGRRSVNFPAVGLARGRRVCGWGAIATDDYHPTTDSACLSSLRYVS